MKSLIENYIDLLTIEKLNEFGIKNDIYLNDNELEFIFKMVKEDWKDILKDEKPYLEKLKSNINSNDYDKIQKLVVYYKKRYKGYLF